MDINLQFNNFAKLFLIGVILFAVCSVASRQADKCVSTAGANASCAGTNKSMFARADEQAKPESLGYVMASQGCVKASVPPTAVTPQVLAAITGDYNESQNEDGSRQAIVEYEVSQGDTISGLAEEFGISTDSIRWANDLTKGEALKEGQKLIIPPVTGVIHYTVSGDSIAQIAKKYQADIDSIVAFNDLSGENDIFVGDILMVPDGKIVVPVKSSTASSIASRSTNLSAMPENYFLCPVGFACQRTQGLHFFNAVDLTAGYCGAPIYAAASGTVVKAKTGGWNGGAGNNITISHMGGTITTRYYHLQTILVSAGQEVKKGDIIGMMGATGQSTGCHLHFEVRGAANPF